MAKKLAIMACASRVIYAESMTGWRFIHTFMNVRTNTHDKEIRGMECKYAWALRLNWRRCATAAFLLVRIVQCLAAVGPTEAACFAWHNRNKAPSIANKYQCGDTSLTIQIECLFWDFKKKVAFKIHCRLLARMELPPMSTFCRP